MKPVWKRLGPLALALAAVAVLLSPPVIAAQSENPPGCGVSGQDQPDVVNPSDGEG